MKPETAKLLEETRRRLFETDEFQASRDLIQWTQPNSGEPENLDVLLDRVEQYAPAVKQWANSFDNLATDSVER